MRVAIASEAWNNPKTLGMYLATNAILVAAQEAGVEAYPLPLASHYGSSVGGLIGPAFQQIFRGYGVPDLVHQTSLAVRHGVDVAMVQDLYPFQGRRVADRFFVWQTRLAVRRARRVVVTTEWMRGELIRLFPQYAEKFRTIALPHEIPPWNRSVEPRYEALWIGRIAPNKDPEMYLSLAAAFPTLRFAMRSSPSPGRDSQAQAVEATRASMSNVVALPRLSEAQKDELYRSAAILVSTSTYEGFHAPAMEAYIRGVKLVLPFIEPYIGLYGERPPNVFWYKSRDLHSLISTFGDAHLAAGVPPSPEVLAKVSFSTVGAKLRALYEELA